MRRWLIFTGVAAAITLLVPTVVVVAAISIVGLPIAVGLMLAPLIFIVSLGAWFVERRLNLGRMGYGLGAVATLFVLAIPPLLINSRLTARSEALIAHDGDTIAKPLRTRVLAIRTDNTWRGSRCEGVCMRALMSGAAERVMFVVQDLNEPLNVVMPAKSFRFERRAACPSEKLELGQDEIKEPGKEDVWADKQAPELIQLEIAKGNCLIEETAALGTADTVISRGRVYQGTSIVGAGLNPFADTVNAERLSVHVREGEGYREAYRRTSVITHLLMAVLAPTLEGGYELRMHPAMARTTVRRNVDTPHDSEADWSKFLIATLKLDLALRAEGAEDSTRKLLTDAIAAPGALSESSVKLAADFFAGIARKKALSADDRTLARALLAETRLSVPNDAWAAVSHARDAGEEYFSSIARSMFLRLASIADTDDGEKHPSWREEVRHISFALRNMPRETILKHRADLVWLSQQERLRVWAYEAVGRLDEFGAEAAPTLLWLMDEAVRLRETYKYDWNNIYVAGLTGLCRMGEEGRAMIAPIYERLRANAMLKHASYWRLTVQTLVRMGASPDEMWPYLQTGDPSQTYQRFMLEVSRSRRQRECHY